MKLKDILNELSFKATPYKWSRQTFIGSIMYYFQDKNDENIYEVQFPSRKINGELHRMVEFRAGSTEKYIKADEKDKDPFSHFSTSELTNNHDVVKVISTVMAIIKDFFEKPSPIKWKGPDGVAKERYFTELYWEASKTKGKSKAAAQRTMLYLKALKANGFKVTNYKGGIYKITP